MRKKYLLVALVWTIGLMGIVGAPVLLGFKGALMGVVLVTIVLIDFLATLKILEKDW